MKTSSGRDAKPCTEPSECRSCHAEIFWVTWGSGKKSPVDAVPDQRPPPNGGSIVLWIHDGEFGFLRAEKFNPREPNHANRNRYTSHWDTSPDCRGGRRG